LFLITLARAISLDKRRIRARQKVALIELKRRDASGREFKDENFRAELSNVGKMI